MGIEYKRPPLPAPTDSWVDQRSELNPTDLATDISRRTDRTSYSIPEDGSPVTFSTKKLQIDREATSQASLLIEYFEINDSASGKPSIRVKVAPSNRKGRAKDSSTILSSVESTIRLPYRRISANKSRRSSGQVPTDRHPFNVQFPGRQAHPYSEVTTETSEPGYLPPSSDISSMPADSMIETALVSVDPGSPQERNQKSSEQLGEDYAAMDSLKAPTQRRSRSLSKERITQKVLEKLAREQSPEREAPPQTVRNRRPTTASSVDALTSATKLRTRKSSRSQGVDDTSSVTGSSLIHNRDRDSNLSGLSKSSLNPKLLQTVEDVVRRLILPEIETIKRHQSIRESRSSQDAFTKDSAQIRSTAETQLSKAAHSTLQKDRLALALGDNSRDVVSSKDPSRRHRHRQSSKESIASSGLTGADSMNSINHEKERQLRPKTSISTNNTPDAPDAPEVLPDDSRVSLENLDREKRERRKKRSRSHTRTLSKYSPEFDGSMKPVPDIPRLPLQSEIADSELTRESILSAETDVTSDMSMNMSNQQSPSIREVSRSSTNNIVPIPVPQGPAVSRSRPDLTSTASDRSLSSKSRQAALLAAGFGAGSSALYGHDRTATRDQRSKSKSNSNNLDLKQSSDRGSASRRANSGGIQLNEQAQPASSDTALQKGSKPRRPGPSRSLSSLASLDDRTGSVHGHEEAPQIEKFQPLNLEKITQRPAVNVKQVTSRLTAIPHPVESHVASLLDPSSLVSISDQSNPHETHSVTHSLGIQQSRSAERWAALRGQAQQQSAEALIIDNTVPPASGDASNNHGMDLAASGFDRHQTFMQSTGDFPKYLSDAGSNDHNPSVLEDQLGDEHEHRGQWPFEPTTPGRSVKSMSSNGISFDMSAPEFTRETTNEASGLGIEAASPSKFDSTRRREGFNTDGHVIEEDARSAEKVSGNNTDVKYNFTDGARSHSQGEEIQSAKPPLSPTKNLPLSFSRVPPRLFEDPEHGPAVGNLNFNRSNMPESISASRPNPQDRLVNYTTTQGIGGIQSRDIMTLMDHLTVRDGQRNARDTEILVTLVRSAAEMRNSFEDMKKFVEAQNQLNMQRGELVADRSFGKSRSTPTRSHQFASPRAVQSSTPTEESPSKKKNLFQRALKGLGGRNTADLNRMEETLNFILEEVAALRDMQYIDRTFAQSQPVADVNKDYKNSSEQDREATLGSHGGAGVTTANGSGGPLIGIQPRAAYQNAELQSNTSSEFSSRGELHYEAMYGDQNGTATIHSETGREEAAMKEDNHARAAGSPSPQLSAWQDTRNAAGRHKSSNSSSFGVPKVSRWSKTTASSVPNTPNYRSQRFSEQTAWGSDVQDDAEENHDQVNTDYASHQPEASSPADASQARASSPLLPDSVISLEEAKYQANRHSLTLQHPQPRQGPTQTQRSLMETQAREYNGPSPDAMPNSPQSDAFGSFPTLARINRFGGNHDQQPSISSPLSSNGRGANRGRKSSDHDPLIPGPETNVGLRQDFDYDENYQSDAHSEDFDEDTEKWIEPVPLARKQSPYSPGGLLAPIEERYSLEQTRSSISATPAQDHLSVVGDRSETPQGAPRAAINGTESPVARKITGPREMPQRLRMASRG